MKHIIIPALLTGALLLPGAGPAWARGSARGGGRAMAGEEAHEPHGRIFGPAFGSAFGWGYYDPFWYGPFDPYVSPYVTPEGTAAGSLRLEVQPKTAQVFVDGAYAGVVDDFNGYFQHLDLLPGGHHVVIQSPGFTPLAFDVYIQPDHTIDYKANLMPAAAPSR